jgi:dTDP-4-dehydrorhamnose 3,5-epimerase
VGTDEALTFGPLPLAGAFLVSGIRHEDDRGWFARNWCAREVAAHGLTAVIAQSSFSSNPRAGTLRGLHYQAAPHEEAKLVTCVRGRIWDVVVDLRPGSPTYRGWHGEMLDGEGLHGLYIPEGCGHGFLTMSDDALVLYQISTPYEPGSARGIRWDDPAFAIEWPAEPVLIGAADRSWPPYQT